MARTIIHHSWALVLTLVSSVNCCRHTITSSANGKSGSFESPNYPDLYPANSRCTYVLQGTADERINITFVEFDLEPGTRAGCQKDYIDIYAVSLSNELDHQDRLCGSELPEPIISIHQKLELVFKSDHYYKTRYKGFKALYMFMDERWQPFPPSSPECGDDYISGPGGVLTSPGFPEPYKPNLECTWMIRVENAIKITINFLVLDMGQSVSCTHDYLALYNGFASPEVEPDEKVCGQLYFFNPHNLKEFKGTSFRMVLRFKSGSFNDHKSRGFKIAWTAVGLSPCPEFHCKGGEYCIDTSGLLCNALQRYCIAESLTCNGIPNCGAFDHSDEEGCATKFILIATSIIAPICAIAAIVTVVFCYRKRRRLMKADDVAKNGNSEYVDHRQAEGDQNHSNNYLGVDNHIYASVPCYDVALRELDSSPSMRRPANIGKGDMADRGSHRTRDAGPVIQYGVTTESCYAETEPDYVTPWSAYGSQGSLRQVNKMPPNYNIVHNSAYNQYSVSATV